MYKKIISSIQNFGYSKPVVYKSKPIKKDSPAVSRQKKSIQSAYNKSKSYGSGYGH